MQGKSSDSENKLFQRLRRLQVGEGMTWSQVAEKLGISVSMLMMVKKMRRTFSEKTLYRLEQAEREVAERKSRAERLVDGLLAGEGTAAQVLERVVRDSTTAIIRIEYSKPRTARKLPREVPLLKPSDQSCGKLRQLFAETMDTTVILLACLPDELRSEGFMAKLTADSRVQLTKAALNLVIPEWRTLAAKSTNSPGRLGAVF
jgi:transcriptional regulator with XRE-family HTH domain